MAEIVELSHTPRRRNGALGRLAAAIRRTWSSLTRNWRRAPRLRPEEWPDYLLRDVGLDRTARDETDPHTMRPRIGL